MSLPIFSPHDDPGPSFHGLLQKLGAEPRFDTAELAAASDGVTHSTTVLAVRYEGGVIMAGDRRATAGNLIAHRTMEKVFPADRYSAVAIAGAAGPAMEMVKLFQLQLEHYEKVEGHSLSLEGKANQLAAMVRGHLPAAMSGMVVVPIFAGYDRRRQRGRLFSFDVTGGRYEDANYVASGSGSLHARTVVKFGYRDDLTEDDAVTLLIQALFAAADDDSATGGPDAIRGIYPIVAAVDAEGYRPIGEDRVSSLFDQVISEFASTRNREA